MRTAGFVLGQREGFCVLWCFFVLFLDHRPHEFVFLFLGLETTVTEFRRCVNKFQCNLFQCSTRRLRNQRPAQSDDALLRADDASFDHKEPVVNLSVVRESTERCDILFRHIEWCGCIPFDFSRFFILRRSPDTVHFFYSILCGDGNRPDRHVQYCNARGPGATHRYRRPCDNRDGSCVVTWLFPID